jgi:hypothetical protein
MAATSAPPQPVPEPANTSFPYRDWPFVCGRLAAPAGPVSRVTTILSVADRLGHWQMRWGLGRMRFRVAPGLYAVGAADAGSPVVVTANYKMSFDLLRRALHGMAAWIMVLDTRGINVWCAAGKGTFGTAEVLKRVIDCRLGEVVRHRTLVMPQLGAPGVAAHEVQKGCGFRVVYGPVRATDLPAFLAAGMQADPAMRRVTFTTGERLVLTPVEITGMLKPIAGGIGLLLLLGGIGPGLFSPAAALTRGGAAIAAGLAGVLAGTVLVPVLLPWLPGRMFAVKGAIVGLLVAGTGLAIGGPRFSALNSAALLLAVPALAAWCAMNFTGSTTFTSPSGVEKEMRRTIPFQAAALLAGGLCWLLAAFI